MAFPLITSLRQGSGWQARINADWILHNPRRSAESAEKCLEKIVAVTQNPKLRTQNQALRALLPTSVTSVSNRLFRVPVSPVPIESPFGWAGWSSALGPRQ